MHYEQPSTAGCQLGSSQRRRRLHVRWLPWRGPGARAGVVEHDGLPVLGAGIDRALIKRGRAPLAAAEHVRPTPGPGSASLWAGSAAGKWPQHVV